MVPLPVPNTDLKYPCFQGIEQRESSSIKGSMKYEGNSLERRDFVTENSFPLRRGWKYSLIQSYSMCG